MHSKNNLGYNESKGRNISGEEFKIAYNWYQLFSKKARLDKSYGGGSVPQETNERSFYAKNFSAKKGFLYGFFEKLFSPRTGAFIGTTIPLSLILIACGGEEKNTFTTSPTALNTPSISQPFIPVESSVSLISTPTPDLTVNFRDAVNTAAAETNNARNQNSTTNSGTTVANTPTVKPTETSANLGQELQEIARSLGDPSSNDYWNKMKELAKTKGNKIMLEAIYSDPRIPGYIKQMVDFQRNRPEKQISGLNMTAFSTVLNDIYVGGEQVPGIVRARKGVEFSLNPRQNYNTGIKKYDFADGSTRATVPTSSLQSATGISDLQTLEAYVKTLPQDMTEGAYKLICIDLLRQLWNIRASNKTATIQEISNQLPEWNSLMVRDPEIAAAFQEFTLKYFGVISSQKTEGIFNSLFNLGDLMAMFLLVETPGIDAGAKANLLAGLNSAVEKNNLTDKLKPEGSTAIKRIEELLRNTLKN